MIDTFAFQKYNQKSDYSPSENTTSKEQPVVSVIITSYNYGRYLADAVRSVLNQTYPNIEIIIVDDGSTDNTKEIASLFPVKYIYQTNQGVSRAKNNGIRNSQGQFFMCLDGDDRLFPTYVEKTLRQILKHPTTAFIYTGSVVFEEASGTENIWMPRRMHLKYSLFAGWHGAMGPVMVRKKAYQSLTYGFDPALQVHEDMDLCFRLLTAGWKPDVVYEPIHWYRIHEGSLNPTTRERKRVAGEFMDKKFRFRKNYRKLFRVYKEIGRVEFLIKSPVKYLKGVQKKIQVYIETKQYKDVVTREKALRIQQEINFTVDMMIEWHNNKSLQKYYEEKVVALEQNLKRLNLT
jgi:glycosyltransferase involved in cell wall biosynthesis